MITVRITIFLLAITFCVSNAWAQSINSSVAAHPRIEHGQGHTLQELSLPFSVQLDSNQVQLNSDGTFTFECTVFNSSPNSDTVYFNRSELLPVGWSTSVCWGSTCYASADSMETYIISPNGSAGLSLDVTPCLNNVPDSTVVWMRVGIVGSTTDTMMLPFYISFVPQNPAVVFQWSGISGYGPSFDTTFSGAGEHIIANLIENGFGLGAEYNFTIQDSLPSQWSLTTCVQGTQTSCTSGNSIRTVFDAFGGSNSLQAVKFTLNVPELTVTDSAIIYLGVHPKISSPADSATYRFSMVVQSAAGVSQQSSGQSGLAITNTWPNPLHPASTLHIGVQSGQDGPVTTGIYDLDGIQKGTLAFGELHAGSNDLEVTIPDALPSGEYLIRVQQGNDTPEIARITYIK